MTDKDYFRHADAHDPAVTDRVDFLPPQASDSDNDDEIHALIRRGAISAWLQPIVNLQTGMILGYEALARGPQDSVFFQSRDLFRAAKHAGLEDELEFLCRRRALEAKRDSLPPGQMIFINFDPRLRLDSNEFNTYRFIADFGIPCQEVVFEVTERFHLAHNREALDDLLCYQRKGCPLALDDLGVGYSDLQALLMLRPDYVKLDAYLVAGVDTDPQRACLVRLLVLYACSSGFTLVAEGIETPSVLESLLGLGVEYGQGFFLGRPAPVPEPISAEALAVIDKRRHTS